MAGERDQVFATRMVLQTYKQKAKGARKGFDLLKKKADALKARIQKMIRAIHTLKLSIGHDVKMAHLALAKATYAAGGGGFINKIIRKEVLKNHISFWLNWNTQILLNRIKNSKKRPVAFNAKENELIDLIKKRSNIYSKALYEIKCDRMSKIEIVKKVLKNYETH